MHNSAKLGMNIHSKHYFKIETSHKFPNPLLTKLRPPPFACGSIGFALGGGVFFSRLVLFLAKEVNIARKYSY